LSADAKTEQARKNLPLPQLMEQHGDGARPGGVCPFCGKKGARVRAHKGRHWFKCFHATCPSGTLAPGSAWDEVRYLAYKLGCSQKDAWQTFLKEAGVWREERLGPSVMPGTRKRKPAPTAPPAEYEPISPTLEPAIPAGRDSTENTDVPPDGGGGDVSLPPESASSPPPGEPIHADDPSPADGDDQRPDSGGGSHSEVEWVEPKLVIAAFHAKLALTVDDLQNLRIKRGLTAETCLAAGLVSNPDSNEEVLRALAQQFGLRALVESGLWQKKPGGPAKPNPQYHGWGIARKKPAASHGRREQLADGDFEWGQTNPVLIPYKGPSGDVFHLRPHKGMMRDKSIHLYIPCPESPSQQRFETAVFLEAEFKALALWQVIKDVKGPDGIPAYGVASLPGISTSKRSGGGWWIRDAMDTWLRSSGARSVVVAFDNEEKGDPKLPGYKPDPMRRYETAAWARFLAEQMVRDGFEARVCVLPKEWRDANGKADWDGALAQLLGTESWESGRGRIERLFRAALANAPRVQDLATRLDLFSSVEEWRIARRVAVFNYEPKLPAAGDKEAWLVKKLQSVIWQLRSAARAGSAKAPQPAVEYLDWLRSLYQKLSGGYYILEPLRSKQKVEPEENYRENWQHRRNAAAGNVDVKWACDQALKGVPKQISDFVVWPFYILRKENGDLVRLVKVRNMHGEVSKLLDVDHISISSPRPLREWLMQKANCSWWAGERELNALQADLVFALTNRQVHEVPRFGWHEESSHWFFRDVAIGPSGDVLPDRDSGIFWINGTGYKLKEESGVYRDHEGEEFKQLCPELHPEIAARKAWRDGDWKTDEEAVRNLFQEVSQGLYDALGSDDGFLVLGMAVAYAAAPEIYRQETAFPGLWLHGEQQQGKSSIARWLIRIWGFIKDTGLPLGGSTIVGVRIGMQQYHNLPLWLEEFQTGTSVERQEVVKNAFNRESPAKKTMGEQQRRVLSGLIITGVATSTDAQIRSRYPHVRVSNKQRKVDNFTWFQEQSRKFFLLGRHLLRHRAEYVKLFQARVAEWMSDRRLNSIDSRAKFVYGVGFAGWAATSDLLLQALPPDRIENCRKFVVDACMVGCQQVRGQVDVSLFWRDLLSAVRQEEFGPTPADLRRYFRVEWDEKPHPPDAPNQPPWRSYTLYFQTSSLLDVLKMYWRKMGQPALLQQSDLQAQMSQYLYWVTPPESGGHMKRFGAAGVARCWAVNLDFMPEFGYRFTSDEDLEKSKLTGKTTTDGLPMLRTSEEWEDPRKGELYELVARLLRKDEG